MGLSSAQGTPVAIGPPLTTEWPRQYAARAKRALRDCPDAVGDLRSLRKQLTVAYGLHDAAFIFPGLKSEVNRDD
jgi:hypothetical protein